MVVWTCRQGPRRALAFFGLRTGGRAADCGQPVVGGAVTFGELVGRICSEEGV
jgi:hypothetical protein